MIFNIKEREYNSNRVYVRYRIHILSVLTPNNGVILNVIHYTICLIDNLLDHL